MWLRASLVSSYSKGWSVVDISETKAAVSSSVGGGLRDGSWVAAAGATRGTAQVSSGCKLVVGLTLVAPPAPSARPTRQAHTTSATGANFSMLVLCVCAGGDVVDSGVGGQQQRQRQQQVLGVSNGSESCSSDECQLRRPTELTDSTSCHECRNGHAFRFCDTSRHQPSGIVPYRLAS